MRRSVFVALLVLIGCATTNTKIDVRAKQKAQLLPACDGAVVKCSNRSSGYKAKLKSSDALTVAYEAKNNKIDCTRAVTEFDVSTVDPNEIEDIFFIVDKVPPQPVYLYRIDWCPSKAMHSWHFGQMFFPMGFGEPRESNLYGLIAGISTALPPQAINDLAASKILGGSYAVGMRMNEEAGNPQSVTFESVFLGITYK